MKLYGDSVLCEMLYYWEFERETRSFLKAFLRPGDIFLDVGANIGLFTLIAARSVGGTGRVHAFEPASRTYERLADNVQLNQLANVTCHRLALSDSSGAAMMTIATDGHDAWNSLGKPYMGSALENETVTTCTLDDFVQQNGLLGGISAIKIDVEGWEAHVLAGGHRTLSAPDAPLLIVEFTEQAATLAGTCCRALYDSLQELGYQMFTLGPDANAFAEISPLETFPNVNVVAAKNAANLCGV
jgi:FkbM family methyltransferase